MAKVIDISGKTFGRLTVVGSAGRNDNGEALWSCKCSCGSCATFPGSSLRSGRTRSCGCLQRENGIRQAKRIQPLASASVKTHGKRGTRLYGIWAGMIQRCENPKRDSYHRYGGRGIGVCERWRSFESFYEDMLPSYSDGLSIDRIDNNKGYCPENCRWVSHKEQCLNRANKIRVCIDGTVCTVERAAELLGLKKRLVYKMVERGDLK